MRYLKTKTGRMHFLKPKERLSKSLSNHRELKTSIRRYHKVHRLNAKRIVFRSFKYFKPNNPRYNRLRSLKRNKGTLMYDNRGIFSSRTFWFFRQGTQNFYEGHFVWDLESKRTKTKMRWGTC